jgi:MFS transporter, DHA1 family, multidrug resistance protein
MRAFAVLFPVFAINMGNAIVLSTLSLFGRSAGLSEFQVGMFFSTSAVLFFLTSSLWGFLADHWGRRPVILAGLAGATVSFFLISGIYAFGPGAMDASLIFAALLFARVIYGLLCSGVLPAAIACMADTTVEQRRATAAARVGAAVGLASIIGPLCAAFLVGFGFATPIVGACALIVVAGFAIHAIPRKVEAKAKTKKITVFETPIAAIMPYLALAFAVVFGLSALQPTTAFFVQDRLRIGTTLAVRYASIVSSAFASCSFVVQAFVVPALKTSPHRLLITGMATCWCGVGICLAATDLLWLIIGFGTLGTGLGFVQPGLLAGALIASGADRQGQIAGHMQAAMSAAWIVGPLAGTTVYALTIESPFLLAAIAIAFGALVYSALNRNGRANRARPADWSSGRPASPP